MNTLVLATDAFGGTGGIAQYTRDIIAALASYPTTQSVTVIPRVISREAEPLPPRVVHLAHAATGKRRFASTVVQVAAARNHFDWIICGHINLLPAAVVAASISGARIILLTYGIEVWYRRGWLTRALLPQVYALVSISDVTFEKMRAWSELPGERTFLIPNAVDLSKYTPGPKNPALVSQWNLQGRKVLLTVGRMEASEQGKGFDEILDVMPSLLETLPRIAYIAIGDGSDRPRLQAKAEKLGLTGSVFFPGYVSEAEKLDYYRLADLFVMPSKLEGFGYVFLEALAAGVPVIASKVDGSREALRSGAWGLLVDPSRPEELIAAIRGSLAKRFVPPRSELDYFSADNFERRFHETLASLESTRRSEKRTVSGLRPPYEVLEK